jgi:hypothetical protein
VRWLAEWAPLTVASFWAFRFASYGDYFDRVRAAPGELAHYCGTGGTVLDGNVLQDPGLFTCPPRYRMLWDLWLSFRPSRAGRHAALRVASRPPGVPVRRLAISGWYG